MPRPKIWLDEVEQAFGRKPVIYSGVSFLETNFSELGGGPPAWAKDYPFWLGWYPNQYTPGMSPLMPRGWFNWTFWQYSKTGSLNGINTKVNLDIFNGTLDELYKFAGVQVPGQTPITHRGRRQLVRVDRELSMASQCVNLWGPIRSSSRSATS